MLAAVGGLGREILQGRRWREREGTVFADPPADIWRKLYIQKGVYPGDNKVVVTVTDDKGEPGVGIEQWTA